MLNFTPPPNKRTSGVRELTGVVGLESGPAQHHGVVGLVAILP